MRQLETTLAVVYIRKIGPSPTSLASDRRWGLYTCTYSLFLARLAQKLMSPRDWLARNRVATNCHSVGKKKATPRLSRAYVYICIGRRGVGPGRQLFRPIMDRARPRRSMVLYIYDLRLYGGIFGAEAIRPRMHDGSHSLMQSPV